MDALAQLRDELLSAAGRVARAEDPEAVHDARVLLRRTEAAIRTHRAGLESSAATRALYRLRRWRRRLGPLRDLEVAAGLLRELASETAYAAVAALAARAAARRSREEVSLREWCDDDRLAALAFALDGVTGANEAPDRTIGPRAGDDPREQTRRAEHRARRRLERARSSDSDTRLHEARLAIKRWRYALESAAGGPEALANDPTAERLKRLQRELGVVHDHSLLHARLLRAARRARKSGDRRAAAELFLSARRAARTRREALRRFRARLAKLFAPVSPSPPSTPPNAPPSTPA